MDQHNYYLQHPRKQLFYRFLANIMHLTATGDKTAWGFNTPNKMIQLNRSLVIIFTPIVLSSEIIYLLLNFKHLTFYTLGAMFAIDSVTLLVCICLLNSRLDVTKKAMKDFMTRIHLYNYQDQGDFVKSTLITVERLSRWTFYYLFIFLMIDCFAWITVTGINNFKNIEAIQNRTRRLETVLYMVTPFDYEYDFSNWIIYHSISMYLVWTGCIMVVIFNTINFMFVYHLIGHIEILKHKLLTNFLESGDDEKTRRTLVEVIQYHSFLISIFRDIEAAFGMNVAANYFYNLIADSLSIYQIVFGERANLIVYGMMVVVYIGGLILMSFVLEEIRKKSDELPILVYNLPWEKMSLSNKKMVIILLARVQPPLVYKAMGGLRAGVAPMIKILKSTFSYYVMLKSSMKK